jgi:hypothetical protein
MNEPHEEERERPGSAFMAFLKILLFLAVGAVVLAVLAFGTCLLLMK